MSPVERAAAWNVLHSFAEADATTWQRAWATATAQGRTKAAAEYARKVADAEAVLRYMAELEAPASEVTA